MNKETIENLCRAYFEAFSQKQLDVLEDMYASDIKLMDWEILVNGRSNVLDANKGLFEKVGTLDIRLNDIFVFENTAACRISICIDGETNLKVLDLISWSPEDKILEIDAYLQ